MVPQSIQSSPTCRNNLPPFSHLEKPSLRRLAMCGKSLTYVMPFSTGQDTLHILCGPIAEEVNPGPPLSLLSKKLSLKSHATLFGQTKKLVARATVFEAAGNLLCLSEIHSWVDSVVALVKTDIPPASDSEIEQWPKETPSEFQLQRKFMNNGKRTSLDTELGPHLGDGLVRRGLQVSIQDLLCFLWQMRRHVTSGLGCMLDPLGRVHINLAMLAFFSSANAEILDSELQAAKRPFRTGDLPRTGVAGPLTTIFAIAGGMWFSALLLSHNFCGTAPALRDIWLILSLVSAGVWCVFLVQDGDMSSEIQTAFLSWLAATANLVYILSQMLPKKNRLRFILASIGSSSALTIAPWMSLTTSGITDKNDSAKQACRILETTGLLFYVAITLAIWGLELVLMKRESLLPMHSHSSAIRATARQGSVRFRILAAGT
jgi:hypothetical protein